MTKTEPSEPQHRYLIAGEIEFHAGDGTRYYKNVNCIHVTDREEFDAKELGKIQTALQMAFHQKFIKILPKPPEVTDVVILSISYLGKMTKLRFLDGAPS